ncbi:hypothetical protein [Rhizorhabdus wittichii]|uniref:hypothetical protein n=1 Tax=Rhizorhabdus wittichii TaxID=160791 RepID=UPI0002FC840A|nr:hypothetical protein [Rhizorhabdus wittichii]
MTSAKIETFRDQHKQADGPWLVDPTSSNPGGVDPLGLRQINFDLMDKLLPGLNNVARHIRPFTVVAWAWRRTVDLARSRNLDLNLSAHQDFVARVEVAFVWSMLVDADGGWREVDLPGRQRVASYIGDTGELVLGDEQWKSFFAARRNSTALTAAVNYGPGLLALRCLENDVLQPGMRIPVRSFVPALDAFEAQLAPVLGHPLFNTWDTCSVSLSQALKWQPLWDLDSLTDGERAAFRDRLTGSESGKNRKAGIELLKVAADQTDGADESDVRRMMTEQPDAEEAALLWKRMQMRQLFRLALEALFEWSVIQIDDGVLATKILAERFVAATEIEASTAIDWLERLIPDHPCPVLALAGLQESFWDRALIPTAIAEALAMTLLSEEPLHDQSMREDRLPISNAVKDFRAQSKETPQSLIAMIIERWIAAQHTYWSVGRGLADARSGGKSILRLRLVLEKDGWTVTRGQGFRGMPNPTPDRLRTAISLAREADLI